jgi:hypothetical protein
MQNLSIFEQLDAMLEFVIMPTIDSKIHDYIINNHVFRENLLIKLEMDGYINRKFDKDDTGNSGLTISVDGKIFLANGGYVKQHELNIINATLAGKDKKRVIRNERLIISGTWVASIVAALLLAWQVYSYYYPAPTLPCTLTKVYKK